jgi:hypothetical protein
VRGEATLSALTDRRLICIWRATATRGRSVETVDLADVESVEATRGRLTVKKKGGAVVRFVGFAKPAQAVEFAEMLQRQLA